MFRSPVARLVSLPSAAKILRILPKRALSSNTSRSTFTSKGSFFTLNSNNNYSLRFAQQQQQQQLSPLTRRFFSSSSASPPTRLTTQLGRTTRSAFPRITTASTTTTTATAAKAAPHRLQGQSIRSYHKDAEDRAEKLSSDQIRRGWFRGCWHKRQHQQQHHKFESDAYNFWSSRHGGGNCRHYFHHLRHHNHYRRRSFIRRMMWFSALFVAVPAVVAFDAPYSSLVFVPLAVGGGLLLTRGLIFYVLPLAVVGGAAAFWVMTGPVIATAKDLKNVLKRNEQGDDFVSALNALGPNWTIQPAKPDEEWFHWTFPEGSKDGVSEVDKVDIRLAVFDPKNDKSESKERFMRWMDKIQDNTDDFKQNKKIKGCGHHHRDHHHHGEDELENVVVRRDKNHVVIQIEEDGQKIMEHSWAKKYLELGKIVDRAATEMEARQPGRKLGEQVVLVHKSNSSNGGGNGKDSFWTRLAPYDLSIRIPFNRTWVHDLTDE
ncbi:hypothetical protein BG004_002282 [Podila humilis]|nr:hypothetical protein BG004_002282 [Podila humilis]